MQTAAFRVSKSERDSLIPGVEGCYARTAAPLLTAVSLAVIQHLYLAEVYTATIAVLKSWVA
jgi:hypothetical protein